MKRGYFDDFKDLKETQGRLFEPSAGLSAPEASIQLPTMAVGAPDPTLAAHVTSSGITRVDVLLPLPAQMVEPGGAQLVFPPPHGSLRAALLSIAFRAGAEVPSYNSPPALLR